MRSFFIKIEIVLLMFVFLFLAGCQKNSVKSVTESFENILAPKTDFESEVSQKTGVQIAEMIFSAMTYTVTEVSENQCVVTVSAPDISAIFWDSFDADRYSEIQAEDYQAAEEELMNKIKSSLEVGGYKIKTTAVVVSLEDGEPVITYELADAFYGGLYSLLSELSEIYLNGGMK